MLFSHGVVTEPTNFAINNIQIEQVGEAYKKKFTKFVVFHRNENLSWKYHIEVIRKIASSGVCTVRVRYVYGICVKPLWPPCIFDPK